MAALASRESPSLSGRDLELPSTEMQTPQHRLAVWPPPKETADKKGGGFETILYFLVVKVHCHISGVSFMFC